MGRKRKQVVYLDTAIESLESFGVNKKMWAESEKKAFDKALTSIKKLLGFERADIALGA